MPSRRFERPEWLAALVDAVMRDIEGAAPLVGVSLVVFEGDDPGTFGVGVYEEDGTGSGAGSREMISAATAPADALVTLADALQEKCAETSDGWGQSRPPCPYHPHPLRPAQRDGQAWWVCARRDEAIYRIGAGEVRATAQTKYGRRRRQARRRR